MVTNPTSGFRVRTNGNQTKQFFNFVFLTGENRQLNQLVLEFFQQNPALSFCVMDYTKPAAFSVMLMPNGKIIGKWFFNRRRM
jgi:hypothetical protein